MRDSGFTLSSALKSISVLGKSMCASVLIYALLHLQKKSHLLSCRRTRIFSPIQLTTWWISMWSLVAHVGVDLSGIIIWKPRWPCRTWRGWRPIHVHIIGSSAIPCAANQNWANKSKLTNRKRHKVEIAVDMHWQNLTPPVDGDTAHLWWFLHIFTTKATTKNPQNDGVWYEESLPKWP